MPQPISLFVSDVDGTLLREDKSLAPATIKAVRTLIERGVQFTLLSARPPSGIRPLMSDLGLSAPFGAFNGGTVVAADGSTRIAYRLDEEIAGQASDMVLAAGAGLWVFADGLWFASDLDHRLIGRERRSSFIDPRPLADLGNARSRVDKLVGVCDDPAVSERLETQGGIRLAGRAQVARSQPFYCDFTHYNAQKSEGLARLAELCGVSLEQTASAGDGHNDIAMLHRSGVSFAMGQALPAVHAAARLVVASNGEDGLAQAIRWVIAEADLARPDRL